MDEIVDYWLEVGLELLDESYERKLDIIKANHPNDVEKCCHKMLQCWLQVDVEANWNKLIYSLEAIGRFSTAERVKQDILLGKVY